MQKISVCFRDEMHSCNFSDGASVLEVLRQNNLTVYAPCGGSGTCGKCKVMVRTSHNYPDAAIASLSAAEVARGVRLACKLSAIDGMEVEVVDSGAVDVTKGNKDIFSNPPLAGTGRDGFGAAVDIGTTTVVCYLYDLKNQLQLAVKTARNPQCAFGADVIARMQYSLTDDAGKAQLRDTIRASVEALICECATAAGVASQEVTRVLLAGNAAMAHLFWGWNCASLARYPFTPFDNKLQLARAIDCGWRSMSKTASVLFLPGIGGFVGADTVAAMIALDKIATPKHYLLIDIGTNGEVVLYSDRKTFACSAAAGPAFEGAKISQGMLAGAGAITGYCFDANNTARTTTYDESSPRGICGSGLIDIVSSFCAKGLISPSGRIAAKGTVEDSRLAARIVEAGRSRELIVVDGQDGVIRLTQKDVRELQLAKAAIRAGIDCLLERADLAVSDIDKIYIAGAFGSKIMAASALGIGLLPPLAAEQIEFIGNAAGIGAVHCLLDEAELVKGIQFAAVTEHLEVSAMKTFQDVFVKGMSF